MGSGYRIKPSTDLLDNYIPFYKFFYIVYKKMPRKAKTKPAAVKKKQEKIQGTAPTKQDLITQQDCKTNNTKKLQTDIFRRCRVSIQNQPQARQVVCTQMKTRYQVLKANLSKILTTADIKNILINVNHNVNFNKKSDWVDALINQLKHCKNDSTLIQMTDVAEINPKQLYITSDNYCHNINELLDYMTSTKGANIEPNDPTNKTKIWYHEFERDRIVMRADKDSRKAWVDMLTKAFQQQQQVLKTMDIWTAIETIGKLGFILLNDEPSSWAQSGFNISTNAIAYFTKYIEKLPKKDQDIIWGLKNMNSSSLQVILGDSSACTHLKGSHLLEIYFYHLERFKTKFPSIELLPLFSKSSTGYMASQFKGHSDFVKLTAKASKDPNKGKVDFMNFKKEAGGKFYYTGRVLKESVLAQTQIEAIQEIISEFDLL